MSYGPSGGQPPYGSGGYGPPPPQGPPPPPPAGGGYGPPPPPPGGPTGPQGGYEEPASKGSAIGATIANGIGLCLTCGGTTIGLILGIIGIAMNESNPKAARICTLISWILFGVGMLFAVIGWIWYFVALASAPTYSTY